MYAVSEAFLEAIQGNTRAYSWSGTITTKDGTEYAFGYEDIVKGSGCITRQCCGSSEIELGTVYASELTLALYSDIDRYTLDGASITLSFHLVLADGSVESVPMGIFEVSEANRNIRTLELTAYDYMLRFEEALSLPITSGTAWDFLLAACESCGVELAQTEEEIAALPNGTETLAVYTEDDLETWRDLLYYVAQALGCVCQVNRDGKLELLQYGTEPVLEVPSEQRFESSYSDFVTRYTAVSSTNLRTEEAEYYALETDDGLTMNLGANPLLQYAYAADRERTVTAILNALSAVCYVPFDSQVTGNPALDPMDVLRLSGGHADETQVSCVTGITCSIGGKMRLKCVGKNPKLAGAKSKTDKAISGLLNQVSSLASSSQKHTVALDFSSWDEGSFTETVDGDVTQDYTVAFDIYGNPVSITDGDGYKTTITW